MDPVSTARAARESLSRGLAALQGPGVPPRVTAAADPVARAMTELHRVESSSGGALAEAAPAALALAREALAILQAQTETHPAIDRGMEAIASSLGVIHQLSQLPATAPAAGAAGKPPPRLPRTQPSVAHQQVEHSKAPRQHPGVVVQGVLPDAPPVEPVVNLVAPLPGPGSTLESAGLARGMLRFEAALGAHSATNFYKGLSGNDVIESGGIFVATYKVPAIGSQVWIHVSLPGGYEFEATGLVRWSREAPESNNDAPPGFGAQFTEISPEARQLVYRYARNREPLFHDDS